MVTTLAVTPRPAAEMVGVTVSAPAIPTVPDVNVRVATPWLSVITLAVTPMPADWSWASASGRGVPEGWLPAL